MPGAERTALKRRAKHISICLARRSGPARRASGAYDQRLPVLTESSGPAHFAERGRLCLIFRRLIYDGRFGGAEDDAVRQRRRVMLVFYAFVLTLELRKFVKQYALYTCL